MAPPEDPTLIESQTGWPATLQATQYSTPERKTRTPLNYGELVEQFIGDAQEASVEKVHDMMAKLQEAANLPDLGRGKGKGNMLKDKQATLIQKLKESAQELGSTGAQPKTNQS